ncbi:LOW QUALITY PROTEIN: hypothetical protein OSB04_031621 [Centaurea solstitialis]|uniref:Uncharacterized protein n=1 Tax=Centaurea solstitialis TaxID=347529 RepID=A0AA38SAR1_9ASTR|nr:LOW QUALITY PROTEIN: hypothetical protein OSB04_031621 [Centaurea solstitialis]
MMHKSEDYSLDDLLKHLSIEEETRNRDNRGKAPANIHSVQVGGKGKGRFKSAGPTKKWNPGPQKKPFKKQGQSSSQGNMKRNGKCHVCRETGHYARECKMRKFGTSETISTVDEIENLVANLSPEEIDMLTVNGSVVLAARGGWYFDIRATVHVCDYKDKFFEYHEVHDGKQVTVANRNRADIAGIGTVRLHFTSRNILTLLNVLHVPTIAKCLVSYNNLERSYDTDSYSDDNMNEVSNDESDDESIGSNAMVVDEVASGSDSRFDKCETCVKSKFIKKPFPSVKRNTSILELIPSDICELNGVYLLHSKDEAFEAFKIYKAEVENQKEKRIKILRSNRGGEYFSREFDTFCEDNGIKHECPSPFTPQQNGLAERKNRTLVDNSKIIHVLVVSVLEATERKSTKSCEKVGKKCKLDPERFRVREVYSSAPRSCADSRRFLLLADFTLEFRSLAPQSK